MNLLNRYGVSDRFLAQATMFPDYILARVVAQYRGKYKIVTEQKELTFRKPLLKSPNWRCNVNSETVPTQTSRGVPY